MDDTEAVLSVEPEQTDEGAVIVQRHLDTAVPQL